MLFRHTSFYCALFFCTSQIECFLQIACLCQSWVNKLFGTIFPKALACSVFLYHILLILTVFLTFSLLLFVMMIFDQLYLMLLLKNITIHWRLRRGIAFFSNSWYAAKSLQSCPTLCDPIDGSPAGSPSLGFSRQEHCSGLPFPSPMQKSEKWKWSCSVVSDS